MKYIFLVIPLVGLCFISSCRQQANKVDDEQLPQRIAVSVKDSVLLSLDKSPMDMIYFPEDYPKQKMMNPTLTNPVARAIYSRPQKKGKNNFCRFVIHPKPDSAIWRRVAAWSQ